MSEIIHKQNSSEAWYDKPPEGRLVNSSYNEQKGFLFCEKLYKMLIGEFIG
jgi:hypothetical protein